MGWRRLDISIKASSRLVGKTWTYFEVKSLIEKKSESHLLLKVSEGLVFRAGLALGVRRTVSLKRRSEKWAVSWLVRPKHSPQAHYTPLLRQLRVETKADG